MNIHSFKWTMAGALMMAGLTGCGGGSSSPQNPVAGNTVIKGTASAGIIDSGTVKVYAVNASGAKGVLLGSATTSIDGKYSASLGAYSGAIEVEVSGGTYTDEATGHSVIISPAKPLHAMVDAVDSSTKNNRVVSVTPLTELAWRKASTSSTTTPAAMVAANKLVDDLYKISDIVGIEPVRPDNASVANATQESKAYTLALAVVSKMASTAAGATDNDKLEATLASMETEIEGAETSGSMNSTTSAFAMALGSVSLSSDFPEAAAQLSSVGKKSQILTLATSGTLPAGTKIYGINGTITLPVDNATNLLKVSLRADNTGKTLSDVFLLAGLATDKGADPVANYLATQKEVQFSVVINTGIDIGDFATLAYNVASATTVTVADFSFVSGTVSVTDINGANIVGVTVVLK